MGERLLPHSGWVAGYSLAPLPQLGPGLMAENSGLAKESLSPKLCLTVQKWSKLCEKTES